MTRQAARPRGPGGVVAAVQRPLASGLTIAGVLLVVLGVGRALLVLEVLPPEIGDAIGTWWPVVLVLVGAWLLLRGRRLTGTALALLGVVVLILNAVPGGYRGPTLLIALGLVLVWSAAGGRRWLLGGGAVALFDDVRRGAGGEAPARSYVAVFGESEGWLDAAAAREGPVECLAVFGDVQLHVPDDVAVQLSEVAVFGDVQAPPPPTGETTTTVLVRATAMFGDVELTR